MDFIRNQIPRTLFKESNSKEIKLINLTVEICKRNKIGSLQPHQRIRYSSKELEVLEKVVNFMLWFSKNECPNFRTKNETEKLTEILIESIIYKKPILFFALFCPSYKKSKTEVGFNRDIGHTTKTGIINLSAIVEKAESLEIPCHAQAIYSDLALENFAKLSKKDFEDLESNFNAFKKFGKYVNDSIRFMKLSEIKSCKSKIKGQGIISGRIFLDKKSFSKIVKRSFEFYVNILRWTEKKVIKRTEDLARSCFIMGEEIRKQSPSAIMVMTENIYERGVFYHANQKNKITPIFYPKKIDSQIIQIKKKI